MPVGPDVNRLGFTLGAFAALFALGFWGGWTVKGNAADAATMRQLVIEREATKTARKEQVAAELERLTVEAERDALAQQLEDQAYADPVRPDGGISADRVRRLNLR